MTLSRSDKITPLDKIPHLYSDFSTSFAASPLDGELGRVTNEAAVKQSIRNIVMTNLGERPFQPGLGSSVLGTMFEFGNPAVYQILESNIVAAITQYEPRAHLVNASVTGTDDPNQILASLTFSLQNVTQPQSLDIIISRVR
jgi:phage baseplate assembly protein W